MIKFEVRRHSVKQMLKSMRKLQSSQYHRIEKATLEAMAEVVQAEIDKNMSSKRYTLDDLRKMDHPYAKRHGTIQNGLGGLPPRIHDQTGKLRRSLTTEMRRGRGGVGGSHAVARIGFLNSPPPYAADVLYGTDKMLPRQVLVFTAMHVAVKRKMMRAAINVLGPAFRTQASVRM